MARKTRKQTKGKIMTIPLLRKSFDHIDSWVSQRVKRSKIRELIPAFQAEWKKTFGRFVDAKAAEAYLALKRMTTPRGRTTRKQKGGSAAGALAGAPLDYMTRAGGTGVYGNFPAYQTSGLDRYYQDSMSAQCGKEDSTPTVPVDMGSARTQYGGRAGTRRRLGRPRKTRKQQGGSLLSDTLQNVRTTLDVAVNRPWADVSPPSNAGVANMSLKGVDASVPNPTSLSYSPQPYNPMGYSVPMPTAVSQNLPVQMTVSPY
jgi:hypothetical protein